MNPTETLPVTIYAEATPNPASMKFVVNTFLVEEEGKSAEFRTADQAHYSPLAIKLFQLPFVKGVFITANFVTVTSDESSEWYEIIPEIKELVKNHIATRQPVFTSPIPETIKNTEITDDIEKKIIGLLDEYIRPAVEGDGGAIHFKSFESGTVTVVLKGSCSGCPSSTLTLKAGIENLLRRMVPEVDDVIAESA